jgi:hypothetical protein
MTRSAVMSSENVHVYYRDTAAIVEATGGGRAL